MTNVEWDKIVTATLYDIFSNHYTCKTEDVVGAWSIGSNRLWVDKKPCLIGRIIANWLFDIAWIDEKEENK